MKRLEKLLHLNLWFHIEVLLSSAVIYYGLDYILSTEQLVVRNVVVNSAKCVNILQKLKLLLEMSQGKPLR